MRQHEADDPNQRKRSGETRAGQTARCSSALLASRMPAQSVTVAFLRAFLPFLMGELILRASFGSRRLDEQ